MTTLTVTEARAQLPALLDRVENGEEITITRHGRAVATLGRAHPPRNAAAAAAIAEAAKLREQLNAAANRPLGGTGISAEYAEELVAQIRRDRDEH